MATTGIGPQTSVVETDEADPAPESQTAGTDGAARRAALKDLAAMIGEEVFY